MNLKWVDWHTGLMSAMKSTIPGLGEARCVVEISRAFRWLGGFAGKWAANTSSSAVWLMSPW